MAAVATFAAEAGNRSLAVSLAASAAAAVGTAPWSDDYGENRASPTVGIGAPGSTAAISLSIDCAATSELCRVRRRPPHPAIPKAAEVICAPPCMEGLVV
jgi:hypothetical protein